jgi:hypothetical protein
LGCGTYASFIFLNNTNATALSFTGGGGSNAYQFVRDLGIAPDNAISNVGNLVVLQDNGTADCKVLFENCYIGGGPQTGHAIQIAASSTNTRLVLRDCVVEVNGSTKSCVIDSSTGCEQVIIEDCRFYNWSAAFTGTMLNLPGTVIRVVGCKLDSSGPTSGAGKYISVTGTKDTYITGNFFKAPTSPATQTAITITGTPREGFYEAGNTFEIQGLAAYSYGAPVAGDTTTGFILGSRIGRKRYEQLDSTPVSVPSDQIEVYTLERTNNSNQTLDFVSGAPGSQFYMIFHNNQVAPSGTITWGTNVKADSPNFTVSADSFKVFQFVFARYNGTWKWVQVSDAGISIGE